MSTTTYTPLTITSFPFNPLTTKFARPSNCGGIYLKPPGDILVVDRQTGTSFESTCYPSGFSIDEKSFFSPGIACPSGYLAACTGTGVSSITTVTCCPVYSTISMSCHNPAKLSEAWESLFCTWAAPEIGGSVTVTKSSLGRTSTVVTTLTFPEGVNAFGIRMVYQATDIPTTSTTSQTTLTSSTTSTEQPNPSGQDIQQPGGGGGGLSTGATVAIAIAIPLVLIAAAIGGFFWWKNRRARILPGSQHQHHHPEQPIAVVSSSSSQKPNSGYYYAPVPGPISYQAGEAGVPTYNQVHAELPVQSARRGPSELPLDGGRHEVR